MGKVRNTEMDDLTQIFELFERSVNYQELNGYPVWKNYDKNAIIRDIEERNQYKILVESTTAIVFSVRNMDKIIWRNLDDGNSIYLHR